MSQNSTEYNWPRIKDLPEDEREPFAEWLGGQTRPFIEGLSWDEQDGYYSCDYERWKIVVAGGIVVWC